MIKRHWLWISVVTVPIVAYCVAAFFSAQYKGGRQRAEAMYAVLVSLASYSEAHGRMPEAVVVDHSDEPLFSWRLSIVPYTPMNRAVFERFDRSHRWDEGANKALATVRPWLYCFTPRMTVTNIFGVTGANTAFDGRTPHNMLDYPRDLIVIIEAAESSLPWSAPGDLDATQLTTKMLQGPNGDGVHVGFADLSVWHLSPEAPVELVRQFLTIDNAQENDRNEELSEYVLARYYED